jgi:hypothetical protein
MRSPGICLEFGHRRYVQPEAVRKLREINTLRPGHLFVARSTVYART